MYSGNEGGIGVEVGYVASHSTHLTLGNPNININALNPTNLSSAPLRSKRQSRTRSSAIR